MRKVLIATLLLFVTQAIFAAPPGTNSTSCTCVSGTVVDASTKKPLADVTVVAVNGTSKSEVVTTNSQGQFKISSLNQGSYIIKLSKDDYKNQEKKDVVVKPENNTKLNIEMISDTVEESDRRSWWDKFDLYI